MKAHFRIKRYNPEKDAKPHWEEYELDVEPTDRVLDALQRIKWERDGTLTLRRSCAHGICGSDAMVINGRNRLACKTLIKELGSHITVEPLRGLPIIKDLVTDFSGFFEKYRAIKPYLINDEPPPEKERRQSPKERARFDDTTKCILCGICTTACPSFWADSRYIGPAAIVQAHRFLFDSRDRGAEERLRVLGERSGVWKCHTIFNCVEGCPQGIDVTGSIGEVKKLLLFSRL